MDHFYGIYGIGAILIIVFSQYFNKNKITLFLGGYALGSVIEYLTSFLVEAILHAKWWDYSNNSFHINGRVCLLYSIFWGILTVFLVEKFNPKIDQLFQKIESKLSYSILKGFLFCSILFLAFDCIATCYAQDIFVTRLVIANKIETKDKKRREEDFIKIQNKKTVYQFVTTYWNDAKMIRTFPNMKIEDMDGNMIYLDSLLPDIQPYYKKIFSKP